MLEISYIPRSNSNTALTSNEGLFTTVIDYDDATALSTQAQALDYSSALTCEGYLSQRRVFVPHIAVAAYSGTFTSFANEEAPWIDSSSNSVQHYGLKTAWTASTSVCTYDLLIRGWFQFRNVR
jgi:hypothetical protein